MIKGWKNDPQWVAYYKQKKVEMIDRRLRGIRNQEELNYLLKKISSDPGLKIVI